MKNGSQSIMSIAQALADLTEEAQRNSTELLASLSESIQALQADTADRRLMQIQSKIRKLREQWEEFGALVQQNHLRRLQEEVKVCGDSVRNARLAHLLNGVVEDMPLSADRFCESVLDHLMAVTGAERGFILFYHPDTTEAEVMAARNFRTTNLSLGEYGFSRTLLREVFQRESPILIDDASQHPQLQNEESIVNLQLKSVVAAPLQKSGRTMGAIYLENSSSPAVFSQEDEQLLKKVGAFVVFYLQHTGLMPVLVDPDRRVFLDSHKASREIVGRNPKILHILETVERIADSPATVLIGGESGTGKELVARALHYGSSRSEQPFVAINCAAIPENLLESELFGHEKGAFTGASEQYIGRIEQADRGTLFLDEVSELAYPLQGKLLRFLQSNEFSRLGGKQIIRVQVRIVAATSKNLKALMDAGKFFDALYYRLNVIPILIPPLREHRDDIPLLWDHFVSKFSAIYDKKLSTHYEVLDWLRNYDFPGNIRELENLAHRLVALTNNNILRWSDVPPELIETTSRRVSLAKDPWPRWSSSPPENLEDLRHRKREIKRMLDEQERLLIDHAIKDCHGNLTQTARQLGIHRVTLHKILRKGKTRTPKP